MRAMARIEDYALIGDLQTAALVGRDGSIDWCCFPRFDSGACFAALLGTPEHGRWLLAPTAAVTHCARRYRHDTLVLETLHETTDGAVRVIDFMPPRGEAPDIVRIVEGVEGTVSMRSELVIRFDYGKIVPWVRRVDHARVAVAGPDALCFRTPVEPHGEDMTTVSEFTVARRRADPVRAHVVSLSRRASRRDRPRGGARRHRELLARVGAGLHAPRRVPRGDPCLAPAAEGADVRADRRDRRGADDVAAGVDRRRPQLGLPLLLAARRDADAARDAAGGVQRGGGRVAEVAAPRRRRRPGRRADHVRARRRAAARGARARLASRVRGLGARAHGERRLGAAAARRLRRGDGRAVPDAPARRAARRQRLVAPAHRCSGGWRTAGAARTPGSGRCAGRHVTSPTRRSWPGSRSTAASGSATSSGATARSSDGARSGTRSTRRCSPGAGTRRAAPSSSTTARTSSTRARS